MESTNVNYQHHWVIIKVFDCHYHNPHYPIIEFIKWDKLTWAVRMKWNWYFRYRAALLQVAYPKKYVELTWGNYPALSDAEKEKIDLQNKIQGKKATITKYKNKLQEYEKNWNSLFPIEGDLPYIAAIEKIKKLEFELLGLTNNQSTT